MLHGSNSWWTGCTGTTRTFSSFIKSSTNHHAAFLFHQNQEVFFSSRCFDSWLGVIYYLWLFFVHRTPKWETNWKLLSLLICFRCPYSTFVAVSFIWLEEITVNKRLINLISCLEYDHFLFCWTLKYYDCKNYTNLPGSASTQAVGTRIRSLKV